jgi:two-component system, NtrC family, response regulator
MATILIIDDDKQICLVLSKLTKLLGHQSCFVHTAEEALKACQVQNCDLILLDLELPDKNGLSILPDLLRAPSSPEVIIITGTGNIKGAELAFKYGAWDFIPKPLIQDEVVLSITRALQYRDEKTAVRGQQLFTREGIVGESHALRSCLEVAAQASATETSVLITGETGTGKELIARSIHKNSSRSKGRFVVVDCASLTESLIESALFGHEKGAFTGATVTRTGLIKQAENGTLFLDEVGELPQSMQKNFLRVLQEKCFRHIGSDTEIQSDFRLLAATNRDLEKMASNGSFRKDLLYRLQSITIHLPPLRERQADITSLVMNHLEQTSISTGSPLKSCSPELFQILTKYEWPGNVRELLNILDHTLARAGAAPILHLAHLPPNIRMAKLQEHFSSETDELQSSFDSAFQQEALPVIREYKEAALEMLEKKYLMELMRRTRGQIKSACDISGLSKPRLYALLKKYDTPRFRESD